MPLKWTKRVRGGRCFQAGGPWPVPLPAPVTRARRPEKPSISLRGAESLESGVSASGRRSEHGACIRRRGKTGITPLGPCQSQLASEPPLPSRLKTGLLFLPSQVYSAHAEVNSSRLAFPLSTDGSAPLLLTPCFPASY